MSFKVVGCNCNSPRYCHNVNLVPPPLSKPSAPSPAARPDSPRRLPGVRAQNGEEEEADPAVSHCGCGGVLCSRAPHSLEEYSSRIPPGPLDPLPFPLPPHAWRCPVLRCYVAEAADAPRAGFTSPSATPPLSHRPLLRSHRRHVRRHPTPHHSPLLSHRRPFPRGLILSEVQRNFTSHTPSPNPQALPGATRWKLRMRAGADYEFDATSAVGRTAWVNCLRRAVQRRTMQKWESTLNTARSMAMGSDGSETNSARSGFSVAATI